MPLLDVNDLTTYFHTRNGVVRAVDGVSFQLEKGETLGIVGESGSGKSVTCMSLLGLIPQPPGRIERGTAHFDGTDLLHCTQKELQSIRGRRVAMIFQDPMTSLNPYLRIEDQLIEPLLIHGLADKASAKKQALAMLDAVGIQDAAIRIRGYPHEFSGGMRQRVMIAMALACKPKLLIADEPTTALDVTVQAQIFDLLADYPFCDASDYSSNAGRATLTWQHTDWKAIAAFAPGVLVGAGLGAWLLIDLPPYLWQLTIGVFVLYLCWGPALPKGAFGSIGIFLASALTSFISLFVGATGPLVASFIKQMHTERFTTVATFATAMKLQHAPKALVFGLAGFVFRDWLMFILAMIGFGFAGTWLGLHVLKSLSNRHFSRVFNVLLTLLALRLLWQAGSSAGWW
mgnify:CR=1 FL=1